MTAPRDRAIDQLRDAVKAQREDEEHLRATEFAAALALAQQDAAAQRVKDAKRHVEMLRFNLRQMGMAPSDVQGIVDRAAATVPSC